MNGGGGDRAPVDDAVEGLERKEEGGAGGEIGGGKRKTEG